MTLQVLRDDGHKNRSRLVEFVIYSKQVQSLNRIMALAGIDGVGIGTLKKPPARSYSPGCTGAGSIMLSGCLPTSGTRLFGLHLRSKRG